MNIIIKKEKKKKLGILDNPGYQFLLILVENINSTMLFLRFGVGAALDWFSPYIKNNLIIYTVTFFFFFFTLLGNQRRLLVRVCIVLIRMENRIYVKVLWNNLYMLQLLKDFFKLTIWA